MRSEWEFRTLLTGKLRSMGAHVSNIESHMFSPGIPDVHFILHGIDMWVELKVVEKFGRISMRPTQRQWHRERREAGGVSWVMVLDNENDQIMVLLGHEAAESGGSAPVWRSRARTYSPNHIQTAITQITEYTKNEQQHASDRHRASQGPGSAGSTLREGVEDVEPHHWLHDKP